MKRITKILSGVVMSVSLLAPIAQGRDHDHDRDDHDRVDFGVRADDHGGLGLNLSIGDRDHARRDRVERVWVDAVWRNDGGRVWVEPVWEKAVDRVWVAPVTRDEVTKVWVDPVYETRETVTYEHGRRVVVRARVKVADGHYEERHNTVVLTEGHFQTSERWVLKSDGHWEGRDNWVCVSEGHYEDRVVRATPVVEERRVDLHFGSR
jgi:hypothetical protein